MGPIYQFMVDFRLEEEPPEEFFKMIPFQEVVVEEYLTNGKLINYALSLDHSKMWAVIAANSESEVEDMLFELPLTQFMQFDINMLTLFNSASAESPAFSLN